MPISLQEIRRSSIRASLNPLDGRAVGTNASAPAVKQGPRSSGSAYKGFCNLISCDSGALSVAGAARPRRVHCYLRRSNLCRLCIVVNLLCASPWREPVPPTRMSGVSGRACAREPCGILPLHLVAPRRLELRTQRLQRCAIPVSLRSRRW
jgi:hypothetical protein